MENEKQKFKYREYILKVPAFLRISVIIAFFALAGYWWYDFSGIYKLLAKIQLNLFNAYLPILTGLFTILAVMFFIVIPIVAFLGYLFRNRKIVIKETEAVSMSESLEKISGKFSGKFSGRFSRMSYWRLVLIFGFIIFLGVGIYFLIQGLTYGELTIIKVEDIAGKKEVPSRYVIMEGKVYRKFKFGIRTSRRGIKYYFPVFDADSNRRRMTGVFLKLSKYGYSSFNFLRLKKMKIKGTLSRNSLPAILRTKFEERFPNAMKNHWVLDYKNTPSKTLTLSYVFLVLSGIFGFISLIIYLKKRIKNKMMNNIG